MKKIEDMQNEKQKILYERRKLEQEMKDRKKKLLFKFNKLMRSDHQYYTKEQCVNYILNNQPLPPKPKKKEEDQEKNNDEIGYQEN